jgi:hypothetical protein
MQTLSPHKAVSKELAKLRRAVSPIAWSMAKKDDVMLHTWERKVLRKLYGSVTEQGAWRIRINQEPRKLNKT